MAKKAKSAPKSTSGTAKKAAKKAAPKAAQKAAQKTVKKADQRAGKKTEAKAGVKKPSKGARGASSPAAKKAKKAGSKVETQPAAVKKVVQAVVAKEVTVKEAAPVAKAGKPVKPSVLKAVKHEPSPIEEEVEFAAGEEAAEESAEEGAEESAFDFEAEEVEAKPAAQVERVAAKPVAEKRVKRRDEVKIDRGGDLEQQWETLHEKTKGVKPLPYKMSENYEAKTPILHKVLGWGYVLSSQNNRLEVLFKDGIKILIANYKGS